MASNSEMSHSLILAKDVIVTLQNDKGPSADLNSFTIINFSAKGDNYASSVAKVTVNYTQDGKDNKVSYIVKLNPLHSPNSDAETRVKFQKEIGFFETILPLLNNELRRINQEPLKTPKCYHTISKNTEEAIFLENLQDQGFKMHDRKKGLDKEHVELIITELAKWHAASRLLMARGDFQGSKKIELLPCLREFFKAETDESSFDIKSIMGNIFENVIEIAGMVGGYEKAIKFMKTKKNDVYDIFINQLEYTEQFKTICHGDCWNNNFLFRYSDVGKVEDCRLLDFQGTRVGSPALDLNFMLYCSLDGDVRKREMASILTRYYATFASVMAGSGVPTSFTLEQLKREFSDKQLFGFINGLMLMPLMLMDAADIPSRGQLTPGASEEMKALIKQKVMETLVKSPLFKPRLLALLDDMNQSDNI